MRRLFGLTAITSSTRRHQREVSWPLNRGIPAETRRVSVKLLLGLAAFLVDCTVSEAWNDAGHMTIARVAWDELYPAERESISEVLRHHPHRDVLLRKDKPMEASEQEWIFLRAAVWSDYVRPPKSSSRDEIATHPLYKYHRSPWHYVNFPYTAGQTSSRLPERHLPDETNIVDQIDLAMRVIINKRVEDRYRVAAISDDQNRAVRLAWLLHLIGDLHQPMHVVALVDRELFPEPPHNDQGGNRLALRSDGDSRPKNLHWIWDEMFSNDSRFDQVRQQAERLSHDPVLRRETVTELSQHLAIKDWVGESYQAAKTYAYLEGKLERVPVEPFGSTQSPPGEIPIVPPAAIQRARQVAERRILLAGRRLAAKIKELFPR